MRYQNQARAAGREGWRRPSEVAELLVQIGRGRADNEAVDALGGAGVHAAALHFDRTPARRATADPDASGTHLRVEPGLFPIAADRQQRQSGDISTTTAT
jgi:hypothetical protein